MDESLKQQILAVDLLRPHSIYFSNCSYLLRQKKKEKEKKDLSKPNFVITQLLAPSLPFPSLGWGEQGTEHAAGGSHPPEYPAGLPLGGTDLWLLQGGGYFF